jgi:hypothetical protein
MPIFAGSRYEGLQFTSLAMPDGVKSRRILYLRIPGKEPSVTRHELLPKQELDFLSFHYLGQSRQWWRFAEVNDLFWPLDLPSGAKLDVPG